MSLIKNWKVHVIALILALVCEAIGTHKIPLGPGVLLFLPMLYAMILGAIISLPRLKVFSNTETSHATEVLGLMTMVLVTKLGVVIGPSLVKVMNAGFALCVQELGHFMGTVMLGLPIAIFLGLGREAVGATFSIDREPNIAIIAEKYGLDSPDGRGVMAIYICGTVFGAIWVGLIAGFLAALGIFHPYALAMGSGVGSGSMMAAATGAIATVFPDMKNDILMYAGASNLLTTIVGIYFCLFVSLPLTNYFYKKLTPIIGPKKKEGAKS